MNAGIDLSLGQRDTDDIDLTPGQRDTDDIELTPGQRDTVEALLARYLPNTEVWVYGSRAKLTSRPQSDLDMVVFATLGQQRAVSDLREAFEDSDLPFRVDLFAWDEVPASFRKQIEADHVVLIERKDPSLPP